VRVGVLVEFVQSVFVAVIDDNARHRPSGS
jgi:hypothetical protein